MFESWETGEVYNEERKRDTQFSQRRPIRPVREVNWEKRPVSESSLLGEGEKEGLCHWYSLIHRY